MTTIPETTFTKILEAADRLQLEDQEDLIRILQNRLRDRRRAKLIPNHKIEATDKASNIKDHPTREVITD